MKKVKCIVAMVSVYLPTQKLEVGKIYTVLEEDEHFYHIAEDGVGWRIKSRFEEVSP